MTDTRKPFTPDRPGLYLLRNGIVADLLPSKHCVIWASDWGDVWCWNKTGESLNRKDFDIIDRAPGDQAWLLETARALIAAVPGYRVVPAEPTKESYARYVGRDLMNMDRAYFPTYCKEYRLIIETANAAERQEGSK